MRTDLFRREALEHHAGDRQEGDILRFDPRWLRWTYRIIAAAAIVAALYSVLFDVREYASGPAVIRVEGRRPVMVAFASTVEVLHVQPGEHVKQGQLLATLSAVLEEAELRRASAEYELALVGLLRDPGDHGAKQILSSLRPRRDQARELAKSRFVRAPADGVVTDVRIRPGQHIAANEPILGLAPVDAAVSLVAVLPGDYRPMLAPRQILRFSLDGYKFEYRTVEVTSVGEEVVGPAEMRKYLGQELEGAFPIQGPTVLVKARLPSRTFVADGETYAYAEGLTGTADVAVRAEPILVTLIPALKSLRPRR